MMDSMSVGKFSWLIMSGAFIVVSYFANRLVYSQASEGIQYLGLVLYVMAVAMIFVPILYIADNYFPAA